MHKIISRRKVCPPLELAPTRAAIRGGAKGAFAPPREFLANAVKYFILAGK